MRAVLYAHDLEPITVLDLPVEFLSMLRAGRPVRLPVTLPAACVWSEPAAGLPIGARAIAVTVTGETFVRNGERSLFLFTKDEAEAMLLRAAFLPGQTREVAHRERSAFFAGFFMARESGSRQ